jgi:cell division protein ZapA
MAQVTVLINGRPYNLSCEPGEEGHLRELAQYLDGHVSDLKTRFGQVGDARLLVMASLTIADQFSETLTEVESLRDQVAALRDGGSEVQGLTADIEARVAADIEGLAGRIEQLSAAIAEE